jgi:conserved domain protein
MKKERKYLPVVGVGPLYVLPIVILTASGIIMSVRKIIPSIFPQCMFVAVLFYVIGAACVALGVWMWYSAVILSRIDARIKENTLVTDGIYAHVRNPIYSAFLFICSGAILIACNLYLLILPPVFLLYLIVFIKNTEEKWLYNVYGEEFENYCKRVNRCIPSIRKKI